MKIEQQDYDSPWKTAIHKYLRSFLAICFPFIESDIDWSKPPEFLESQLPQTAPKSQFGACQADVVVKVCRRNGQAAWVVVHLEVQSQPDPVFHRRMWTYHYRLVDRHDIPVVSVAVLADRSKNWRPDHYECGLWGCQVRLDFPTIKLLDLEPALETLLAREEPFAYIVAAHLRSLQWKSDSRQRLEFKRSLVQSLFQRNWARDQIQELFRLIDWLMNLTPPLTIEFKDQLHRLEEEKTMQYISSIEKLAIEEGREIGRQQGLVIGIEQGIEQGNIRGRLASLRTILNARFPSLPARVEERLKKVQQVEDLDSLLLFALACPTLAEFEERLPA
jgi:hypothetical protein